MTYTEDFRKALKTQMEKFGISTEKQVSIWNSIAYIDSGEIKKVDERSEEEEIKFQNAVEEVNDMVYYLHEKNEQSYEKDR